MTHKAETGCMLLTVYGVVMSVWCWLAALMFDYVLWSVAGKDIPWYVDLVAGFIASPVMLPGTVICWVMTLCGVQTPFIGG